MRIFNPTHEQYLSAGFFPVRQTDKPVAPAGKRYVDTYAMEDGEIVQSWVLEDWEKPATVTDLLQAIERGLTK